MTNTNTFSLDKRTFWQEVKNQLSINANLKNEEEAIEYVCIHYPQLINQPELGGMYPIHIMISKCDINRVNKLLCFGANLELKVNPQTNAQASLALRLAERFQGMNAIEIALSYSKNNTLTKKQKENAQKIYNLILTNYEKQKIEKSLPIMQDENNPIKSKIKI